MQEQGIGAGEEHEAKRSKRFMQQCMFASKNIFGWSKRKKSKGLGRKQSRGEKGHADGESVRKKLEPSKWERRFC